MNEGNLLDGIRKYAKMVAIVLVVVVLAGLAFWFRAPLIDLFAGMGAREDLRWNEHASALGTVDLLALAETKDQPGVYALVGIDYAQKMIAPLVDLRSQSISVIEARFTNSGRRIVLSTLGADGQSKVLFADMHGTIEPDDTVPASGEVRLGIDMNSDENVLLGSVAALTSATPTLLPLGFLDSWTLFAVNDITGFATRVGIGRDAHASPVGGEFIYLAPPGVTLSFMGEGDPNARYVVTPYRDGATPSRLILSQNKSLALVSYEGSATADLYTVNWNPLDFESIGTVILPTVATGDAIKDTVTLAGDASAPGILAAQAKDAGLALTLSTRVADGSEQTTWSLSLPSQIISLYPTDGMPEASVTL